MRILHVEGGRNLYGGAQQVLYLLEGLHRRGVENLLVCRVGSDLSHTAAPFATVRGLRMGGDLDLSLTWRLRRLMRGWRPDLVHLHSRIGADVMGGIAARLAGVPAVYSRRQDNPEARWAVALKYRLHRRVVAISEGIGRLLLSEGLPAEKLVCVRSAVDAGPFLRPCDPAWFQRAFALEPDAAVIGVVAQLIARKGHRFLLQALPALLGEFPRLRVLLFGQGPAEAEIRRQIGELGLAGVVSLAGFRRDLADVLPCLRLLVHPAIREGLGVSLLQASSAGVPIVAGHAGGIPEAVRDGVNGLLVPPGDVAALTQAIGRLLRDPDLAQRLGRAGRELMLREFSVDAMVEGNLAVYRQVLAEEGRAIG
jgi:glycosyltransferase involved in cell wall biosynthesis